MVSLTLVYPARTKAASQCCDNIVNAILYILQALQDILSEQSAKFVGLGHNIYIMYLQISSIFNSVNTFR